MNETATTVEGFAQERFAFVRDLFEQNFATGQEIGASFSVTVAAIWTGWNVP